MLLCMCGSKNRYLQVAFVLRRNLGTRNAYTWLKGRFGTCIYCNAMLHAEVDVAQSPFAPFFSLMMILWGVLFIKYASE